MTGRRFFWSTIEEDGNAFTLPNTSDLLGVYSLERYGSYTGNCIRVVRNSDSTTLDIGFIGDVLDTASIASFCSGTTGTIDRWYDQSGVTTFVTGAVTSANRPVIYESGAILTLGGKPTLRWPTNGAMSFPAATTIGSAFFVYKLIGIQALNVLANGGSTRQIFAGGTAIGGVNGFTIYQASVVRVSNTSENTNYNLSSFFGDSDDRIDTNNSDPAVSGASFVNVQLDFLGRTGAALGVNGFFHEVILYSTSQYSDKATIENMINGRYSIY